MLKVENKRVELGFSQPERFSIVAKKEPRIFTPLWCQLPLSSDIPSSHNHEKYVQSELVHILSQVSLWHCGFSISLHQKFIHRMKFQLKQNQPKYGTIPDPNLLYFTLPKISFIKTRFLSMKINQLKSSFFWAKNQHIFQLKRQLKSAAFQSSKISIFLC